MIRACRILNRLFVFEILNEALEIKLAGRSYKSKHYRVHSISSRV